MLHSNEQLQLYALSCEDALTRHVTADDICQIMARNLRVSPKQTRQAYRRRITTINTVNKT